MPRAAAISTKPQSSARWRSDLSVPPPERGRYRRPSFAFLKEEREAPGGGNAMSINTHLPNRPPQGGKEQTEFGADVTTLAAKSDTIFAANRAFGSVTFSVKSVAGRTRRAELHEAGSLRVRCPGAPAAELEAVLINTAGGIAG